MRCTPATRKREVARVMGECVICHAEFSKHGRGKAKTCGKVCSDENERRNKLESRRRRLEANPEKEAERRANDRERKARPPIFDTCVICLAEFRQYRAALTCGEACSKQHKKNYDREYQAAHPEMSSQKSSQWKRANPEKIQEYSRRYCEANREIIKQRQRARDAEAARLRKLNPPVRPCEICGKKFPRNHNQRFCGESCRNEKKQIARHKKLKAERELIARLNQLD